MYQIHAPEKSVFCLLLCEGKNFTIGLYIASGGSFVNMFAGKRVAETGWFSHLLFW